MPLFALPKHVFLTADIILQHSLSRDFFIQIFEALDIANSRIIKIKPNEYVYTEDFYTITYPYHVHGCLIHCLNEVSKRARNKFKAEKITPKFIGLSNRYKGSARHFTNLEEFHQKLIKKYPNEQIILMKISYNKFEK